LKSRGVRSGESGRTTITDDGWSVVEIVPGAMIVNGTPRACAVTSGSELLLAICKDPPATAAAAAEPEPSNVTCTSSPAFANAPVAMPYKTGPMSSSADEPTASGIKFAAAAARTLAQAAKAPESVASAVRRLIICRRSSQNSRAHACRQAATWYGTALVCCLPCGS